MFLLPIILGAAAGIVLLSTGIEYCLNTYSFPTSMFFVGLVVGSLPLIYNKATAKIRKFKAVYSIPIIITFAIVVILSFFSTSPDAVVDTNESSMFIMLFFAGIIASSAMVIPGISGSFMLMLLGLYPMVIHAIAQIKTYLLKPSDFSMLMSISTVLIPLGIGVIVGIILVSKLIEVFLKRFESITYFAILGLILGSVYGIFSEPITYKSGVDMTAFIIGVIMLLVGFFISVSFGKE